MDLSIVIPTYNRAAILRRCLEALRAQDFDPAKYEIIVVDDGSVDRTPRAVAAAAQDFEKKGISFTAIRQENAGQGAARNRGVRAARGNVVVLIGDDIIVVPDFLKEHWRVHAEHEHPSEAVLGFVAWHPELDITPLMRFMTSGGALFGRFGGHQFAFDRLEGKTEADFRFFYTANISLKRELLLRHPFDPWFSSYGWEDIELGYRLTKQEHLRLYYNSNAVGYHYHPMDERDFERRMRTIGQSVHIIQKKYPELHYVPAPWKRRALRALASRPSVAALRAFSRVTSGLGRDLYFYALSKRYFLDGLREGEVAP